MSGEQTTSQPECEPPTIECPKCKEAMILDFCRLGAHDACYCTFCFYITPCRACLPDTTWWDHYVEFEEPVYIDEVRMLCWKMPKGGGGPIQWYQDGYWRVQCRQKGLETLDITAYGGEWCLIKAKAVSVYFLSRSRPPFFELKAFRPWKKGKKDEEDDELEELPIRKP